MSRRKRAKPIAKDIQSSQNSQDDSTEPLENSQNSKSRSKNYSADESAALIKCCDVFHAIINKNSNHDKDKKQKEAAWQQIKSNFIEYCKSQGIYVSKNVDCLHNA